MPKKKYLVDLSSDERQQLSQLVRRGKHSSRKVTRARILLLASDGATDEQIVAALKTAFATVERTRKRFVEEGLWGLNERPRRGAERKLTGKQEAHLVAGKVVELGYAPSIARETVRQVLKKTNSSHG